MRVVVDTGAGPPVLFLHGQPGAALDFAPVVPLLREHVRVLLVDRPGYAGDNRPAEGFAGNAAGVLELLDALEVGEAVLVGHSWGGGVALAAALAAPRRVRGLVLVASVGVPEALDSLDHMLAHPLIAGGVVGLWRALGPRFAPLLESWAGSRLDPTQRAALKVAVRAWQRKRVWPAFLTEQRALVAETPDLAARLGEITCPAVVLHGRRDGIVPIRAGRALAAALPRARLSELDAGHLLTLETPGEIARAVGALVACTRPAE